MFEGIVDLEDNDISSELEEMEHDYLSMESIVSGLDAIGGRVSVEGICQLDITGVNVLASDTFSSKYPLKSFTSVPSKTNLRPALESILNKAQEFIWRILESVGEFISKVLAWLGEYLTKAKTSKDVVKVSTEWKKAVEERIAALEKRLSDIDNDKDLSVDEKVQARSNAQSYATGTTTTQTQVKSKKDEAYTIATRVCMHNTNKVVGILDALVTFPHLRENIQNTVKTIEATLNAYDKRPSSETLLTILGATNDLTTRFTDRLNEICVKLNRNKVSEWDFGHYDTQYPDEFLGNVRNAILTACRTPSGKSFREDFKYGFEEAYKRIQIFAGAAAKTEELMGKKDTLTEELTALSSRLRKAIRRIRNLSVEATADQIEIRNRLLDVSKLLRRSLFAYMRLREIPSSLTATVYNFTGYEHYSESEIANGLKNS